MVQYRGGFGVLVWFVEKSGERLDWALKFVN